MRRASRGLEKGFEGGFKVKRVSRHWWGLQKGFKGLQGGFRKV